MPRISVQIQPTHRPSVLSAAQITLQLEDGSTIEVRDCRVMRNRQGVLWAALPSYSVTIGKQYEYHPSVVLSPALHREVADAILAAYASQEASGGVR